MNLSNNKTPPITVTAVTMTLIGINVEVDDARAETGIGHQLFFDKMKLLTHFDQRCLYLELENNLADKECLHAGYGRCIGP